MSEIQIFAPFYFGFGVDGSGKHLEFYSLLIFSHLTTSHNLIPCDNRQIFQVCLPNFAPVYQKIRPAIAAYII